VALTYTQLLAAVQTYTENDETDFVAEIPRFVRQIEERILKHAQLQDFRKNSTGTMTASNQYLVAPTDYLSSFSMAIIDGSSEHVFLTHKDVNFIREAYPAAATTGEPRYYAEWDDANFLIGPTPDSGYTTELHYFFRPNSIVDDETSWMGDNAEEVLLYGTLVEAYTFMKGESDLLELYNSRYQDALARLKNLGEARQRKDTYRSGQIRTRET
jgi:hypothetical protein|tara:strand:- start:295 stop:936 length:642 start_codon:yes stop_codon:yes gene_type:complete